MGKIAVILMVIVFSYNIFPALISRDTDVLQRAVDRTQEQVTNITTEAIVNEAQSMPFKMLEGLFKQ